MQIRLLRGRLVKVDLANGADACLAHGVCLPVCLFVLSVGCVCDSVKQLVACLFQC